MDFSQVAGIVGIVVGIITILGSIWCTIMVVVKYDRRLRSMEKDIESTPPIRERLVKLEEKTEEIKNLKNTVAAINQKYWEMEGTLRVHEEIFTTLKNTMNKVNYKEEYVKC